MNIHAALRRFPWRNLPWMILAAGLIAAIVLLCYGRVRRSMVGLKSTSALVSSGNQPVTVGGAKAVLSYSSWTKGNGGELTFEGDPETYFERRVAVTDSEVWPGNAYLVPVEADGDPEMEFFAYQPGIGNWARFRAIKPGAYVIDHDGGYQTVRPLGTLAAYRLTGIHTWYVAGSTALGSVVLACFGALLTGILARRSSAPGACT